jgi:hypothetical protein
MMQKSLMDPLKKIRSMSTNTGIYQHGKLNKPNPEFGYAIEDQARALIVVNELGEKDLQNIYLDFILRAKRKDGLLYHFFYGGKEASLFKNEEHNSISNTEEAYGITLWSLLAAQKNTVLKSEIIDIIGNLIKDAGHWTSPRTMSAALLGLVNLDCQNELENNLKIKLHGLYHYTSSPDWNWFENALVYANAIIPWSLWEIHIKRGCRDSFEIAKQATDFLIKTCQENNFAAPVGNKGWYVKCRTKALYDQQPIDSAYMVCCLEKAYIATGDSFYLDWAKKWYQWFWGSNTNNTSLIDKDFACYDALIPEGVNLNQGAESNICFVMAYLAAKRLGITA